MVLRSLRRRIEGRVARAALRMPPAAAATLARRSVVVDGRILDPNIALVLRLMAITRAPSVPDLDLAAGRAYVSESLAGLGGRLPVAAVDERSVPGPAGDIAVRHYIPTAGAAPAPTLVWLHGGGWVYGDLDTYDPCCRFLAEQAGVRVLSVAYRLAPEHPYPAAVEDCWAAWTYLVSHVEEFGADQQRIAVGGDSAGGNLAMAVAMRGRAAGLAPAFQLLAYPATDFGPPRRSRETFARGFVLEKRFMDFCESLYLPDGTSVLEPEVSPVQATLTGLPPTYLVTAGFDPLRDEGEALAARLREAGGACEYVCEDGLVHSFVHMVDGGPGRDAMTRVAAALRRGLR